MKTEINGTIIDVCANFTIFQAEHNGYPIIYRTWKNGKIEFKATQDLINSGIAKMPDGFELPKKECWIDLNKRG